MGKATFRGCISLHIFSIISWRVLLCKFWKKRFFHVYTLTDIQVRSHIPCCPSAAPFRGFLAGRERCERGWTKAHGCHGVHCPNTRHSHLLLIMCRKAKHRPRRKCIQHLKKIMNPQNSCNKPHKFIETVLLCVLSFGCTRKFFCMYWHLCDVVQAEHGLYLASYLDLGCIPLLQ